LTVRHVKTLWSHCKRFSLLSLTKQEGGRTPSRCGPRLWLETSLFTFLFNLTRSCSIMMLWIEKQSKRPTLDLAHDFFVGGLMALCIGGLFIWDCVSVSMKPAPTTNGQGPNVKPCIVSRTMRAVTTNCAYYIACNGFSSHALANGGFIMAKVRTSWSKTKRK